MPRSIGYLAAIASENVVSVCLGLERISRPAQAKSEVVQGVVGASPRSCAQRPRTQVRGWLSLPIEAVATCPGRWLRSASGRKTERGETVVQGIEGTIGIGGPGTIGDRAGRAVGM